MAVPLGGWTSHDVAQRRRSVGHWSYSTPPPPVPWCPSSSGLAPPHVTRPCHVCPWRQSPAAYRMPVKLQRALSPSGGLGGSAARSDPVRGAGELSHLCPPPPPPPPLACSFTPSFFIWVHTPGAQCSSVCCVLAGVRIDGGPLLSSGWEHGLVGSSHHTACCVGWARRPLDWGTCSTQPGSLWCLP
jgi:hypothetical protein